MNLPVALLAREPQPSPQAVRDALSGNLCRCGAHLEILAAVAQATAAMAAEPANTGAQP